MEIRITTGQAQPGKLDELARQWREIFGAGLQEMPGFRHGYFGGDRATNTVVGVTLWEAPPDPALMQQHLQEFLAQAGHLAAGPPQAAVYELLAEV